MDQFTKLKSEKLEDNADAGEFNLDYSTDSVFLKSPVADVNEQEAKEIKKGFWKIFFESLDEQLTTLSKDSEFARRFKIMINFFKLRDTLTKLDKINNSVDELVRLKVPYGENEKRYQALANRLMRANQLRTELQKEYF